MKAAPAPKKALYCSFCGKPNDEVEHLIAGPQVFICNECVELCVEIIERPKGATPTNEDR